MRILLLVKKAGQACPERHFLRKSQVKSPKKSKSRLRLFLKDFLKTHFDAFFKFQTAIRILILLTHFWAAEVFFESK
jgi:hypothetical protein